MSVSFHMSGGDLPGLARLRELMNNASQNVLVGVPEGAGDEGKHVRTEQQQMRFDKKRESASLKSARKNAANKAESIFRAFTLADDDELRHGPIAQAMKRDIAAAKANAKSTYKGSSSPEATALAMVAAVHEFGYPEGGIPERSFLRSGIHEGIPKFNRLNEANLRAGVLGGKTIEESLDMLGVVAAGEVKRKIRNGPFAPLKPATIARKGSSKPLIDSGQLIQSITFVREGEQSANAKVIR
jgi:hypothetical protein